MLLNNMKVYIFTARSMGNPFAIMIRSGYGIENAYKQLAKKIKKSVELTKQKYKYLNQYILLV